MLSILVTGVSGRMGRSVLESVEANPETVVGGTHDQGEALAEVLPTCDAVIDFSHHSFTTCLLEQAVALGKLVVIGTTGHTDAERAAIAKASESIPIVFASNFSVGVNTLFWLTRKAADILNEGFDIEVVEMHHHNKVDAPSGTARSLAEILCQETGMSYANNVTHGRVGDLGARPQREIGMHSLRGGDVVGDHTVIFAGDGERVELSHKASSRMTFANGAVRAALWLRGRAAGLYDMEDVLGFRHL
ncbi:MAG: 4-hydroxy-tetrahydrodipicolinate reductase [Akkermansia sp.]